MKFLPKYLLILVLLKTEFTCSAEKNNIDSLLNLIRQCPEDTSKIRLLNSLAWKIKDWNPDSSIVLSGEALSIAEKYNFLLGAGKSQNSLGVFYYLKSDYPHALAYYQKSILSLEKIEQLPSSAYPGVLELIPTFKSNIYNNVGIIFTLQANYPKAVENYLNALAIMEKQGKKLDAGEILTNLAVVYWKQKDYKKALEISFRVYDLGKELGNKSLLSSALGNIASIYNAKGDFDKALEFANKALRLNESDDDLYRIGTQLGNIGEIYMQKSDYSNALIYYQRALVMKEKLGNRIEIAMTMGNIGTLYVKTNQLAEARKYLTRALDIYEQVSGMEGIMGMHKNLSVIDEKEGKYNEAFRHYKLFISYRDSISNDENVKKQTQLEMQFDFDKKQTADSVRVAEEKKVAAAELRTEKNKSYTLYGGLSLVLIFAGFIFNRFRVTQKQKVIIENQKIIVEEQKQVVEEKQKEILDSINYARRIQMALMPKENLFSRKLNRNQS